MTWDVNMTLTAKGTADMRARICHEMYWIFSYNFQDYQHVKNVVDWKKKYLQEYYNTCLFLLQIKYTVCSSRSSFCTNNHKIFNNSHTNIHLALARNKNQLTHVSYFNPGVHFNSFLNPTSLYCLHNIICRNDTSIKYRNNYKNSLFIYFSVMQALNTEIIIETV